MTSQTQGEGGALNLTHVIMITQTQDEVGAQHTTS